MCWRSGCVQKARPNLPKKLSRGERWRLLWGRWQGPTLLKVHGQETRRGALAQTELVLENLLQKLHQTAHRGSRGKMKYLSSYWDVIVAFKSKLCAKLSSSMELLYAALLPAYAIYAPFSLLLRDLDKMVQWVFLWKKISHAHEKLSKCRP